MNNKRKTQTLLLTLVFCLSMVGVRAGHGMIPENRDVEMGAQLIENKIDFLLSSLEEDPQIKISENFKEKSHIYKWIHYAIKNPDVPIYQAVQTTGKLHESGDPLQANIQLNETIKKLLELVRVHEDLDPDTLDVIDALLVLLDASPEAYSREAGIITSAASDPKGTTKESYELASDKDKDKDTVNNFRYYGKLYDLDSEVFMYENGILEFSETGRANNTNVYDWNPENVPVALSPFNSTGGDDGEDFWQIRSGGSAPVAMTNSIYRKYTWKVSTDGLPEVTVSAGLFEGTGEPSIVFDYYNDPNVINAYGTALNNAFAFLFPGSGNSADDPGSTVGRNWQGMGDLFSSLDNHPLEYSDNTQYTPITNFGDGSNPIILDTMYVFLPDQWGTDDPGIDWHGPLYRGTLVPRNLVHDSKSVPRAIDGIILDQAERTEILSGKYCPGNFSVTGWDGNYEYGLQTVGKNSAGEPTLFISGLPGVDDADWLDYVNHDGLLAYTIQEDEDFVNREIVKRAVNRNAILDSIYDNLDKGWIRARDAALEELHDAQAGRVFKDRKGNWVRTQQYVMRTADNKEVQILSLTHRSSGVDAGFSTLDFRARVKDESYLDFRRYPDLQDAPWTLWLDTKYRDNGCKYVSTTPSAPWLDYMSYEVTNPHNDGLKETRNFERAYMNQEDIIGEILDVNGSRFINVYDPDNPENHSIEYAFDSSPGNGEQVISDAHGNPLIEVSFYELNDNNERNYNSEGELDPSAETFKDIWDALRVNEGGEAPNIGESSLEIVFSSAPDRALLSNPIDVIYIPMSRMLWKGDLEG